MKSVELGPAGKPRRVGGIATQRQRTPRKKVAMLRAFPATCRDGAIKCTGGAWVKRAGEDDERVFDREARLNRNIGDVLIVIRGDEVSAVEITRITSGWLETWFVKVLVGAPIANGNVTLMGGWKAS